MQLKAKIKYQKLLSLIFLLAVVGSSFWFIQPQPKIATAQQTNTPLPEECAYGHESSQVQVNKSATTNSGTIQVYAKTVFPSSFASDCSRLPYKHKFAEANDPSYSGLAIVFSIWDSASSSANILGWVAVDATFNASLGPKGGMEGGYAINLGQLQSLPSKVWVYAKIFKLRAPENELAITDTEASKGPYLNNSTGIGVDIGATDGAPGSIRTINSHAYANSQFTTGGNTPDIDCSGTENLRIEKSKNDPVELYVDEDIGVNGYSSINAAELGPGSALCDSHDVTFVFWVKYGEQPDVLPVVLVTVKPEAVKDSAGKFLGWKGGQAIVPGSKLTEQNKASIQGGANLKAEVTVKAYDGLRRGLVWDSPGANLGRFALTFVTKPAGATDHADNNSSFQQLQSQVVANEASPYDNFQYSNTFVDFLTQIIGTLISWIQEAIVGIFSYVVLPLIETLLRIPTYTDSFAAVILPGWELLRNLANIFFILVLLAIGLGTLFRIPGYQYRGLLLKLIFAALMVNFSLVLTQSFLAIAETAQFQFLPPSDGGNVIKTLANQLMIAPLNQNVLTPDAAQATFSKGLSLLIFPFFYLSLTLMAFVVMCSLAFFLVLRMIVIWILLMTSPIAIVGWILPKTNRYAQKWFSNLMQYGFFIVILGFFLNVTAYMATKQQGVLKQLDTTNKNGSLEDFLSRIATNIFVMGFMLAGIFVAASMKEVYGSGAMAKYAKKAGKLPFDFLKFAGERTFEGVQNKVGLDLDPRLWKKSWDGYLKRREEEKDERIKKRKMGKGSLTGKISPGVGSALGNSEQFLENFLTTKGWNETVVNKVKGAFGGWGRKAEKAQADASAAAQLLSDDQREQNAKEIKELTEKRDGKAKLTAGTKDSKKLLSSIEEEIVDAQNAIDAAVAIGNDPTALKEKKKALEKARDTLSAQTSGEIDETALLQDIKNLDGAIAGRIEDAAKKLKKGMKDGKEKDETTKRIDELAKLATDDDEARKKAEFSEYDSAKEDGKDYGGKKYKAVNDHNLNELKTKASLADIKSESRNFKQLLKDSAETAKAQSKLMAEYKEQGLGEDASRIIAEIESSKGKKDYTDRFAVLMQLAATNGHSGAVLGYFGKDGTGDGLRELMKEQLAGQDKSDKIAKSILQKLDEIHKKNGELGLAFTTQRIGQKVEFREAAVRNAAYNDAVAAQSTRTFLSSSETNIFDIKREGSKVEYVLKAGARRRLEAMDPSEASQFISAMSPQMRKKLMNSTGYKDIVWKVRGQNEAKKGNKYTSGKEALERSAA